VIIDGELESRITADMFRNDLAEAGMGDGRYAFSVPISGLVKDNAKSVDLRLAETGEQLAHSPLALTETLWAHRQRLLDLLDGGPFWLSGFRLDGVHLEVTGGYQPTHGDVSRVAFDFDGAALVDVVWDPPDEHTKRRFWFLNPRSGGFRARVALGPLPQGTATGDIRVSIIDPSLPMDPLRFHLIPTCASNYRNLPDARRQERVMGWSHNARFAISGRTHHEVNRMLAERYGLPTSRMRRILDLGVGCGRIARHFLAHDPHIELHGVDIDADNVAWCTQHLPGGQFQPGPLSPPLPYSDRAFDFVHANSVFTHLTEPMQDLWLAEIARILTPEGLAVVTYHGETAVAYARMPLNWIDRWIDTGIDAIGLNRDLEGFVDNAEYYRNTYHTRLFQKSRFDRFSRGIGGVGRFRLAWGRVRTA
jgi:SAM-dependent methyltransferase